MLRQSQKKLVRPTQEPPLHNIGGDWPSPQCSVLLATKDRVDVVLDFQDSFLQAGLVNYADLLMTTFGRSFEFSRYKGDVIIRTGWNRGFRRYAMYDLAMLGFLSGEIQSGTRSEPEASFVLSAQSGRQGQTEQHVLSSTQKEDEVVIRTSAIVRVGYPQGPDAARLGSGFVLDLTDGSEWFVGTEAMAECLPAGRQMDTTLVGSGKIHVSVQQGRKACDLRATFVKGW